jgi:hypothetical protein
MRQSEGNNTAKRLSAICPVQLRLVAEAIEGLVTAALAWLARILSPVLLKTASVLPAGILPGRATLQLPAAIEYNGGRVY